MKKTMCNKAFTSIAFALVFASVVALLFALPALICFASESRYTLETQASSAGTDGVDWEETDLGNLCADAFISATGAELAFFPSDDLGITLNPGTLTEEDLRQSLPADENLYIGKMTREQITALLEISASHLTIDMSSESLNIAASEFGGWLQAGGLTVELDATAPVGGRVYHLVLPEHDESDDSAGLWTVCVSESIFTEKYGYTLNPEDFTPSGMTEVEALEKAFSDSGSLKTPESGRVKLLGVGRNTIVKTFPVGIIVLFVLLVIVFGRGYKKKQFDHMR